MPKLLRLVLRGGAQGAPLAGVLGEGWGPAGGLLLYWAESVMLLGATLAVLAIWARRRGVGPAEMEKDGLRVRDVAIVHGGAFGIFGLFLAGLLFILVGKGHVEGAGVAAAAAGLPWIALFVGVEWGIDLVRLSRTTTADLVRRVDAGSRRFFLFWIVGFFGIFGMMLTGRPLLVFALFAGVKIVFEVGAALERAGAAGEAARMEAA